MTEPESRVPRVLVVWCPDWPVVATATPADDAPYAVAVVDGGRVAACSDAARAAGVRRGQRPRLAQRLCPDLALRDRDPEAETRRFEPVVQAVESFTPRVEVLRPGLCAIPVKGPGRYFGGEAALAAQVHAAVTAALARGWSEPSGAWTDPGRPDAGRPAPQRPDTGHPDAGPSDPGRPHPQPLPGAPPQVGLADGLFAAALAARAGALVPPGRTAEFLAPYPVSVLGDAPLADLLARLGVGTLGDFAALDSESVADRFGPAGTAAHRTARGLRSRPLTPRAEGTDLAVEQRFDPPETLAEPLVFAARPLAERLHAGLGAAGLACRRVAVEVTCADGRTATRLWRHEDGLAAAALAERVRWQLQAWQSAGTFDDCAGGFTALRLVPDGLGPDTGRQLALWGEAVADDRVERAAARVQAVLGYAGLCRAVPAGGRGPGERTARIPWGEAVRQPDPAPWPGRLDDPPPSVVPPAPVPVGVADASGLPVTVSGRAEVSAAPARILLGGRTLRVTGWTGPWPAVEHWWDPDRRRRRARFQVAVADGRALLLTVEGGRWFLEAAYD